MHEVRFTDGTPVPEDYLSAMARLVHDAALAIDMFGENALEAANIAQTTRDRPPSSPADDTQ